MTPRLNSGEKKVHLLSPPPQFLYLISIYLLGLCLFAFLRLFFLITHFDQADQAGTADLFLSFVVGIRFDQIIILFVLLLPLLVLPWISNFRPLVRKSLVGYFILTYSLISAVALIDIGFFAQFDSHLNYLAYEYLDEGALAWNLIGADRHLSWFSVTWLILTALLFWVIVKLTRFFSNPIASASLSKRSFYFIAALALVALGMRGRAGLSPLSWGAAYFSQHRFVNQLSLNGIYTLAKSFAEENRNPRLSNLDESRRFRFTDFSKGMATVRAMLETPNETWHEGTLPLMRTAHQPNSRFGFRPNIMIVMMESWAGQHTGALGSDRGLTPSFDRLADKGMLFMNFYASGVRTNYGLGATLCSYPSLPGRAIMKRYSASHPFVSISELLHQRGYFNGFIYGGDLVFDNIEGFFREKQFDRFWGEDDFSREDKFSKWGVPDHLLFERVVAIVDSLPRPFQLTVLTLSNHEPYELPDSSVRRYFDDSDSSKVFNSLLYADHALGKFMTSMRQAPSFDSTIFLFTSDHGRYGPSRLWIDPWHFRVPLLIYSPSLIDSGGTRITTFGSQTDITPTLMGLLGGEYTHASWGRNLLALAPNDGGFAAMNVFDRIGYIDMNFFYYEKLSGPTALIRTKDIYESRTDVAAQFPDSLKLIRNKLRSFLQIADQLSSPLSPAQQSGKGSTQQ